MAQIVVRVKPNSRKSGISVLGTEVEVRVNEPPLDGRANEAVRASLAEALHVPRNRVTLARGAHSKEKAFDIEGLEREEILVRLHTFAARSQPASE